MNLRLSALLVAVASMMPVAAMGQVYQGEQAEFTPSVIRPVGHGTLWDDYDGGCGCQHGHGKLLSGPIGCPYGAGASCGCGGCGKGCNYRIGCGVPYAFHRLTRSLDCLFPCRPKLLGCGSGWGGCSPCNDPSCGGGCPKPCLAKRFGGFGGCAKCDRAVACNLDCSCGTPVPTFGTPSDIPAPMPTPDMKANPFQDDGPPEPMPSDARRAPAGRSHFSNGPTPARRPANRQASLDRPGNARQTVAKPIVAESRVQRAAHNSQMDAANVQQASAESDDVIRNYTLARERAMQTADLGESDELPHNPLR
jgi:hypothetical protein